MSFQIKFSAAILILLILPFQMKAEEKKPETIYLFGKKPIQLEATKDGIKQNRNPGFVCELKAKISGEKFSEWGQTEEDARLIVAKNCSDKAGLLLCKKENATCIQDK
ncbi:MAG: hypothetical protein SGI74_14815 [Oligoflexia bacterium]|nr:hypothetical protein [Oligoflexia bacterium]